MPFRSKIYWRRFLVKELIETYDNYIRLLIGELEDLVSLGASHGWKSTRHEAGKLYREKIKALKSKVLAQQHLTHDIGKPRGEICPVCEGSCGEEVSGIIGWQTCFKCNGTGKPPAS